MIFLLFQYSIIELDKNFLQGPSASAYVTYNKYEDALRAIQAINNIWVDNRQIKTSLGTTKYCSHFIKAQTCPKADCMYLHDLGEYNFFPFFISFFACSFFFVFFFLV